MVFCNRSKSHNHKEESFELTELGREMEESPSHVDSYFEPSMNRWDYKATIANLWAIGGGLAESESQRKGVENEHEMLDRGSWAINGRMKSRSAQGNEDATPLQM